MLIPIFNASYSFAILFKLMRQFTSHIMSCSSSYDGTEAATVVPGVTAVVSAPLFAVIHGCCMTILSGIRRSGFATNNFDIKCVAAFDRKAGAV